MKERKSEKELFALNFLGKAFLKLPRTLIAQTFGPKEPERSLGRMHLTLFCLCNHTEKIVHVGNYSIKCPRGEYAGTYRMLALLSGLSLGKVGRLLAKLQEMGLINILKVPGGSRIKVYGYDDFTFPSAPDRTLAAGKDTKTNAADATTQMREAEKKIGGRRMPPSGNKHVN